MRKFVLMAINACMACAQPVAPTLPYFNTPDFEPQFIAISSPAYAAIHTIPPFSFTNQHAHTVTENDVTGKVYVADFFYTRCSGICPKMITNMKVIADSFASDPSVMFLSHSVSPESDSVAVLQQYATAKNITGNWHLLTGDKQAIYTLARNGYFAELVAGLQKDTSEFLHTENFLLIDKHRRIRGIYNGTLPIEVERLVRHIRLLKTEE